MIPLSHLPRALRDRLASLLVALCSVAVFLVLTGCGGGNLAPVPVPTGRTGSDVTEIVVNPKDDQAQAARSIVLSTLPLGFLPPGKTVTMTTLSPRNAAIAYKLETGSDLPSNVAGWYRRRQDTHGNPSITFVGDGWGDWLVHMSIHEWAHFVQLDNCTEQEFAAWRVAYNSAKTRGALPTDYSKNNEYEGWAESVTQIYTNAPLDSELHAVVEQVLARMTADRQTRAVQRPAPSSQGFPGCSVPAPASVSANVK